MATIIKKKKVSVSTVKAAATVSSVSLTLYKRVNSIRTIAATFGAAIPRANVLALLGRTD